jgi:hypothetical protein
LTEIHRRLNKDELGAGTLSGARATLFAVLFCFV